MCYVVIQLGSYVAAQPHGYITGCAIVYDYVTVLWHAVNLISIDLY